MKPEEEQNEITDAKKQAYAEHHGLPRQPWDTHDKEAENKHKTQHNSDAEEHAHTQGAHENANEITTDREAMKKTSSHMKTKM
jgi:hypothetical protein